MWPANKEAFCHGSKHNIDDYNLTWFIESMLSLHGCQIFDRVSGQF